MVRLGTNLDPTNIREGTDVYFDCIIKAHPYVYKVEWRHNVSTYIEMNLVINPFELDIFDNIFDKFRDYIKGIMTHESKSNGKLF